MQGVSAIEWFDVNLDNLADRAVAISLVVSTCLFNLPSKEGSDNKGVQSQKGIEILQANIQFPNTSQSQHCCFSSPVVYF